MGFALPGAGGGGVAPEGGVFFTAIRDRLLRRKSDSGDHRLITASGTFSKAEHVAHLKSSFGVTGDDGIININNIRIRVYLVGGGGGGAYGAASCYGGFPGIVVVRDYWLHELPDSVPYTIGAGGTAGNWGGTTTFNAAPLEYVTTEGISRGANDGTDFKQLYGWMRGKGMDPSVPDLTAIGWGLNVTGEWLRPNSAHGPGMGGTGTRNNSGGPGTSTRSSPREGGNSGMRSAGGWRRGGFGSDSAADRNGADHNALFADSYGAGGVGALTQYAQPLSGNGGFPGGGGGSGDSGGPGSAGTGGNGCIKIMSWIREAV